MEGVFTKLRNLDAYPKINEDFYSRTFSGGVFLPSLRPLLCTSSSSPSSCRCYGHQHLDIRHDIVKKRIDTLGNVIESRPDVIGGPLVVPTEYTDIRSRSIKSNQVTFKEEHISFMHFLTNICAIVGGIFTLAGIIDSIYHGQKTIRRKMEISKLD